MLATHNTMTYLEPRFKVFNICKWLWKCQDDSAALTKADYVDLRIRKTKGKYVFCHGLVDLDYEFNSIVTLLNWINRNTTLCRVIIERGKISDEDIRILNISNKVHLIVIKKGWKIVCKNYILNIVPKNYEYWEKEISFKENVKKIKERGIYTIKSYARKYNKSVDINSKDTYYMIDYYNPKDYNNA